MITAIPQILSLISEFIPDSDKQAEIEVQLKEIERDLSTSLLNASTTPNVDAAVKLMIAFRDILMPLLRPIGAACMTGFAGYCALNGIDLSDVTQSLLFGAFPAWGASRHVHKGKEQEYSHDSYLDSEDFD